jgi:hypothetical protein
MTKTKEVFFVIFVAFVAFVAAAAGPSRSLWVVLSRELHVDVALG